MEDYAERLSIMEHQLREAIIAHNRPLALAYALQLRNWLDELIADLECLS